MEDFIEKFNLFDIVAMLIPGLTFIFFTKLTLNCTDTDLYSKFEEFTILALLIFGYILGFVFQEIGAMLDKIILHKFYYGGDLKEIFLMEAKKKKVFDNDVYYYMGQLVKEDIIKASNLRDENVWKNEGATNRYVYNYLLDYLEIKGLKAKSDKMQVLTELGRSLMAVSAICVVLSLKNISIVFSCENLQISISVISAVVFMILTWIFFRLKTRYEKYRIRTMIRTYFIFNNLK